MAPTNISDYLPTSGRESELSQPALAVEAPPATRPSAPTKPVRVWWGWVGCGWDEWIGLDWIGGRDERKAEQARACVRALLCVDSTDRRTHPTNAPSVCCTKTRRLVGPSARMMTPGFYGGGGRGVNFGGGRWTGRALRTGLDTVVGLPEGQAAGAAGMKAKAKAGAAARRARDEATRMVWKGSVAVCVVVVGWLVSIKGVGC